MYGRRGSSRRLIAALALMVGAAVLTALPLAAVGQQDPIEEVTNDTTGAVKKVVTQVAPPSAQPQQQQSSYAGRQRGGATFRGGTPSSPGGYQPPLHGTNPHGQGTPAVVDLGPSDTRPLSGDTSGGDPGGGDTEEIVVGRTRGEQLSNGQYHGKITILALFGNDVVAFETNEGETENGPLQALQNALDQVCSGSGDNICLQVLFAESRTTGSGSSNEFRAANVRVGDPENRQAGINATAAESEGNISEDGSCQTATGRSHVANASIGGAPIASVAESSASSRACRDGTRSQTNDSRVLSVLGENVPLCPETGRDNATLIPTLLPGVCHADDTNGAGETVVQAATPYGVRESLSAFVLDVGGDALIKATTSASESHAVAPAGPPTDGGGPGPDGEDGGEDGGDDGEDGAGRRRAGAGAGGPAGGAAGEGAGGGAAECVDGIDNDGDGRIDFPDDPQCESPSDDSEADGALAFTGSNVLLAVLLGLVALLVGLRMRSLSERLGHRVP